MDCGRVASPDSSLDPPRAVYSSPSSACCFSSPLLSSPSFWSLLVRLPPSFLPTSVGWAVGTSVGIAVGTYQPYQAR